MSKCVVNPKARLEYLVEVQEAEQLGGTAASGVEISDAREK